MPSFFDRVYEPSPVWFQNIGVSIYGYIWRNRRFGGEFKQYVEAFENREAYSTEEWEIYQTHQLQKLLTHAVEHVPYYQRKFSDISKSDLAKIDIQQLAELPLLEKDVIRSDPETFVADIISPHKLHTYHTSGTTGTPLAIKFTNDTHRRVAAVNEARVRRWAGVHYKMSRAMIGGRVIVQRAEAKPPFWRYNIAERQLYMSAFHISPKNAQYYVQALNRYRPDYLIGYTSSHFFLARMIVEQGLDVIQPKAVLTSSEKLTPEMRATIEKAYRCKVFDTYGGVEACCFATECEQHRMHICPDVGIMEIVDENGQLVEPGEVGEIVATGLLNFTQPLIRYRTGDLAKLSLDPCGCGRQMPVLEELVGRLEDTVIGPDGRETVRFHGIFVGLPHIREGQVIQETLSKFRLRLVALPEFNQDDRKTIYRRFEERMGPIDLELELVDHIDRTEGGKFRAVISKAQRKPIN